MGENNEVEDIEKTLHEICGVKYCWVCDDPHTKAMIESTQKRIKRLDLDCLRNRQKLRETIKNRYELLMELSRVKSFTWGFSERQTQKTLLLNKLYEAPHNLTSTNLYNLNFQMLHGTKNLTAEKKLLRKINTTNRREEEEIPSNELNCLVWNLYRRMEYYSKNKVRDEEIFKEMKMVEKKRKKKISSATSKGKNWNPSTSTNTIQDEIKVIKKIGEELRKENWEGRWKIDCIEENFKEIEKLRSLLMKQSDELCREREESVKHFLQLKKRRREATCNCIRPFYA